MKLQIVREFRDDVSKINLAKLVFKTIYFEMTRQQRRSFKGQLKRGCCNDFCQFLINNGSWILNRASQTKDYWELFEYKVVD